MEQIGLTKALRAHETAFGLELDDAVLERLADHYQLIMTHNERLHLVAPCSAEEFAIRHLLESLTLLKHLPRHASFADVGPGAGLPSIPCLIARNDLRAQLIESKEKKAGFLEEAMTELALNDRAVVSNKQFSEASPGNATYVTCRALDRFSEHLPRLLRWAGSRKLLLFGGNNLADALRQNKVSFDAELMPLSDQRYLFVSKSGDHA